MKLYACKQTCSLSVHIALHELDLQHEVEWIDLRKGEHRTPEYLAKNPTGVVPLLEIQPGQYLSEVQAILQYLADSKPGDGLAPSPTDPLRPKLHQWLSFISTELHKNFTPLFFAERFVSSPEAQAELRKNYRERLEQRWQIVSDHLGDSEWMLPSYSVVDIYLFVIITWWLHGVKQSLAAWPNLEAFNHRMLQRFAVQKALQIEQS